MDSQTSNVLPPPSEGGALADIASDVDVRQSSGRHRLWAIPAAVVSLLSVFAVSVAAIIPSKVVAEKENTRIGEMQPAEFARVPGSAQAIGRKVSVSVGDGGGAVPAIFEPDGDFMMVTVMEPSQSVLSWWVGKNEPAVEMLTYEDKFGFQTAEQRRVFSLEQMRTSEEVAEYVALSWLGFPAEILPGDVLISEIACLTYDAEGVCASWPPSADVLQPGDRLVSADGVELASVNDLVEVLQDKRSGDTIEVRVDRGGEGVFDTSVELTSAPDEPNRTIIGFIPFDTRRVELPFSVSIDTGSVGGPSAGLAFTLTLIDALSEGSLTGGERVAVTGTIDLDGSVGAIGGLVQKASAVEHAGVRLFLVPASQRASDVEAARRAAPTLEIVSVATLDEAISVLVDHGAVFPERPAER